MTLVALVGTMAACASVPDPLYEAFRTPEPTARPFVRWWWNGARVEEAELLRELDVMKQAGIGGVEINTIAMPEATPQATFAHIPPQEWLTPGWNRLVRVAADAARARGMTADLLVGSGWPFGGRFVPPEQQIQRVRLVRRAYEGPTVVEVTTVDLEGSLPRPSGDEAEAPTERTVLFARLSAERRTGFDAGIDLTGSLGADGVLRFEVPDGEHQLYVGFREVGFSHVKLGAPGADGPVVDHLNGKAVRAYLDHLSGRLAPSFGGKLGNGLRAMFVDSLELDKANWTGDFEREFERRRGYAVAPFLPFLLEPKDGVGETGFAATVRRARYDYWKTIVELFGERFVRVYADWCRANGVLSRMQAYGREAHPLEASLEVDLPEGETWLWNDRERKDRIRVESTVVNRYVSSAGHIAGKRVLSFEAMTNAVPVFREMPEDFKLGMDATLLSGLHHPIVHGFNYSPPAAGFPGWIRFGSFLNERNPWWPYFRKWTDYAARLAALFREAKPGDGQVALLAPRADEWARHGLLYQPFPEVRFPAYQYALGDAIHERGSIADFVSESLLQKAKVEGGKIRVLARTFELLVLQEVESIEPETAEALLALVRDGARVAFVGRVPRQAPGLRDVERNDRRVTDAVEALFTLTSPHVALVPPPKPDDLVDWTADLLRRFQVAPAIEIESPDPALTQTHARAGDRDIYFFANGSRRLTLSTKVRFPFDGRIAWRWDPESGERALLPVGHSGSELDLQLGPAESLLVVFDPPGATPPKEARRARRLDGDGRDARKVLGPWQLELQHVYAPRSSRRTLGDLVDFGKKVDDVALSTFAGKAIYRTTFIADELAYALLHLGGVHGVSEVSLNGVPLGVRWYGEHVYDAAPALRRGENRLEVKVTTTLGNYMRSISDVNPVARRWARSFLPVSTGMVGPVELRRPR